MTQLTQILHNLSYLKEIYCAKPGWRRVDRQIHLQMEHPIRRSTITESLYLSWEWD